MATEICFRVHRKRDEVMRARHRSMLPQGLAAEKFSPNLIWQGAVQLTRPFEGERPCLGIGVMIRHMTTSIALACPDSPGNA